jgi:hypothetical protein
MTVDANAPYTVFNGGVIGDEVMARVTMDGYTACAEKMDNWLPWPSGPMSMRPGLGMQFELPNDAQAWTLPFVYSVASGDKYMILLQDYVMRVVMNGGIIVRPAGFTAWTGDVSAALTSWTAIGAGAAGTGSSITLISDGSTKIGLYQQVACVASTSVALNITVTDGPVRLRVGSLNQYDDYIAQTDLGTGYHSLQFTPSTATYWVELSTTSARQVSLASIGTATAGDLTLPTPWPLATLPSLRWEESGNTLYVTSGAGIKQRIERRGLTSWSIVDSGEMNGPMLTQNVDTSVLMTPTVKTGAGVLGCSQYYFTAQHVGALFAVTHQGQSVVQSLGGSSQFTNAIKVTNVSAARTFYYSVSGTWAGTLTLQKSVGIEGNWQDVSNITTNVSTSLADGLDNQTIYYRIGFKPSAWTSGSAAISLTFSQGSTRGICRVTAFSSPQSVNMEVISQFGGTIASYYWEEGAWSDYQGHPKAVALYDGRLWNLKQNWAYGSDSASFESYTVGDADNNQVNRPIGVGSVNPVVWAIGLERLIIGTEGAELVIRSTNLDDPVTPTNNTLKPTSTMGSADIQAIRVDTTALFVERSGIKLMELVPSGTAIGGGYNVADLCRLNEFIGKPGITRIALARQPHPRVFVLRSDGVLLVKLYATAENAMGWSTIITDGLIEDVCVLPADSGGEDQVYVIVNRTIGAVTKRFMERLNPVRWSTAAEVSQVDCFYRYDGVPVNTITVPWLVGKTVEIWADGARKTPQLVPAGGVLALDGNYSAIAAGLSYTAQYVSTKPAFGAQRGTALGQQARPTHAIFLLLRSFPHLSYGQDFTLMDSLSDSLGDRFYDPPYDTATGLTTSTTGQYAVPGHQDRDPRMCLQATSPYPVALAGYVYGHRLQERV